MEAAQQKRKKPKQLWKCEERDKSDIKSIGQGEYECDGEDGERWLRLEYETWAEIRWCKI